MKVNYFLYLIAVMIFIMGCSSSELEDSLACIDVTKNYPKKEIILSDIADIKYVHLETENKDYLYKGKIRYISENNIIITDRYTGSILFFSANGKAKSRFNHFGLGPEEYTTIWFQMVYDESEDDLFVKCPEKILVYSSIGEYKRSFNLPQGINAAIFNFDELSFLGYDSRILFQKMNISSFEKRSFSTHYRDSSFFRISKTDGKVLDYIALSNNDINLAYYISNRTAQTVPIYNRVVRCLEGAFLMNHETDTVYLYSKNKSLIPIIHKKPLLQKSEPRRILDNFIDVGQYQYMEVIALCEDNSINGKFPPKYYIRDKKIDETFIQKLILPDYKGKNLHISVNNTFFNGKETIAHFEFELIELKEAYRENKLSGKLKELVATLNEYEDNNVFMFVHFKQ